MTPQTRRRIGPLGHDTYYQYAPWPIVPPGVVGGAPGRHAYSESII
jgi:hypothetical protein